VAISPIFLNPTKTMNHQQIQSLELIETQLISLLATLPNNQIKFTINTAKKSLHAVICQALEVDE